jgi:2-succinyl-6-hydroxy-2,4-cyclohexadiene-1-carboxylate synthase
VKLHREVHPGDGPYLLLVHGMLAGRSLWGPNLPALRRVARPVVVELWGHGRSPSPEDPERYRPEAYVEAFDQIREELGAERWLVCGQSYGAALTLRYALDHPERVIAQAFTNSTSALGDAAWAARMRDEVEAMAAAVERGGREAIEALPIHPLRARRIPPETHAGLLEDAARLDPAGIARSFRFGIPGASVRDRVGENRVPTLLVCGERESVFRPHREHVERAMPVLEVRALDAGHAVNLEAASEFDEAVTGFFSKRSA